MAYACTIAVSLILFASHAFSQSNFKTFDGHSYELINTPMSWSNAEAHAREKGGLLAIINSFPENVFLQALTSNINTTSLDGGGARFSWLGGSDLIQEGNWHWVDALRVDASSISSRQLWSKGPDFNPDAGGQDCLAMSAETWPITSTELNFLGKAGQWNDLFCSNKLSFVIEYDVEAKYGNEFMEVRHLIAGEKSYWATFSLIECASICLKLNAAGFTNLPREIAADRFVGDTLTISRLRFDGRIYKVVLKLIDGDRLIFEVISATSTSSLTTFPEKSWVIAEPISVGMDESKIQESIDYAFAEGQNTQGLVIVRHGVIVAEKYATSSDENSIATSWSTAKSFTSALVGAAVDRGFISAIDISASEFIPAWANDERKNITIKNLLMMSSGLLEEGTSGYGDGAIMYTGAEREDGTNDANSPVNNLLFSIDRSPNPDRAHWLGARFNWNYQNADVQVLGEILESATGKSIFSFAEEVLFSKLGINASWWTDAFGNYMSYCCLDMTSRDFARFGLLYAREGMWLKERIVSGNWVVESTNRSVIWGGTSSYGYLWWPDSSGEWFMALGLNSNNIYVHPGLDIVVVRNSHVEFIGEGKSRSNGAYHATSFPAQWNHRDFFQPIIDSAKSLSLD